MCLLRLLEWRLIEGGKRVGDIVEAALPSLRVRWDAWDAQVIA